MARDFYSNLDGDPTGINEISRKMSDGRSDIFDMQGRKVQNPTNKGLYIRNGKKFIVK
jgi:hypothetical protein